MSINVTPGSGATVFADNISGEEYQGIKIVLGADGAADVLLDSGQQTQNNSMPVTLASNDNAVASLAVIDDSVYTSGSGTPSKGILSLGTDGTNPRAIKTDTDGHSQVDVLSIPTTTNVTWFAATNISTSTTTSKTELVTSSYKQGDFYLRVTKASGTYVDESLAIYIKSVDPISGEPAIIHQFVSVDNPGAGITRIATIIGGLGNSVLAQVVSTGSWSSSMVYTISMGVVLKG